MALLNVRSLSSKTFILNEFISSTLLDSLLLTETWLESGEYSQLLELCPPSYDFLSSPMRSGRGGGISHFLKVDLVFTLGLTIASLEDLGVSDHQCIRISTLFHTVPNPQLTVHYSRFINTSTASNFSNAYRA